MNREYSTSSWLAGHGIEPDLLSILQKLTGTSPLDVMNVRMIVEPQAASVAAANASESALASIREAHERATVTIEMEAFEVWDGKFHQRIFEATRNEFLTNLHDIIHVIRNQSPWIDLKKRTFRTDRRAVYCKEHEAMVVALEARDSEAAAQAMRTHLETVAKNLFGARS
jgi:DNA-binding FadR family transcriptional regulator